MALLPILHFPDPKLKLVAEPVLTVDDTIKTNISDMFETLYEASGLGLAATQVNIHKQIIVIDLSNNRTEPKCLINPSITTATGALNQQEGCLSFPGVFVKVKRYQDIVVQYIDSNEVPQTISANGLLSICLQHEIDHLKGITFYDHLSAIQKTLVREKILKLRNKTL